MYYTLLTAVYFIPYVLYQRCITCYILYNTYYIYFIIHYCSYKVSGMLHREYVCPLSMHLHPPAPLAFTSTTREPLEGACPPEVHLHPLTPLAYTLSTCEPLEGACPLAMHLHPLASTSTTCEPLEGTSWQGVGSGCKVHVECDQTTSGRKWSFLLSRSLSISFSLYIYMYICIHVYIYIYTYKYTDMSSYTYVHTCISRSCIWDAIALWKVYKIIL